MNRFIKYFRWADKLFWPYFFLSLIIASLMFYFGFRHETPDTFKALTENQYNTALTQAQEIANLIGFVIWIFALIFSKKCIRLVTTQEYNSSKMVKILFIVSYLLFANYLVSLAGSILQTFDPLYSSNTPETIGLAMFNFKMFSWTYIHQHIFPFYGGPTSLLLAILIFIVAKSISKNIDLEQETKLTI